MIRFEVLKGNNRNHIVPVLVLDCYMEVGYNLQHDNYCHFDHYDLWLNQGSTLFVVLVMYHIDLDLYSLKGFG